MVGSAFSNIFDIQICQDKINLVANYPKNAGLILNLYKNLARLIEVSVTQRSGCWRFDCIHIYRERQNINSRISLVRIPGDRQNVYSLSGIRINRCYMY